MTPPSSSHTDAERAPRVVEPRVELVEHRVADETDRIRTREVADARLHDREGPRDRTAGDDRGAQAMDGELELRAARAGRAEDGDRSAPEVEREGLRLGDVEVRLLAGRQ